MSEPLRETNQQVVGAFIKRFCELYKAHTGASYLLRRKKDVTLVQLLLGTYPLERLIAMAEDMLTCGDPWIESTDKGLGILTVRANWLAQRAAKRTERPERRALDTYKRHGCPHDPPCNGQYACVQRTLAEGATV